ncbi:2-dehydro-3-deoxygalactonokinase [Leifsonia bigeumensis]|uniref:2-dehydro-3-deoxygalactonokinase n=1 Tax=Leifsonella bigeumensis TaxID=433643 RepID=A0ABP7FDK2_9MICO
MTDPALLGVDWGSSRLRGYVVAADGRILEAAESDTGVLTAERSDLADALVALLGGWRARWPDVPIVASGMVGSRTGLREVPYVSTPAGVSEVRSGMQVVAIGGMRVAIVPGLVHRTGGSVDVIRGEETILLGCPVDVATGVAAIVLPGTHSKWAQIDESVITDFCTFATGEFFDSMLHSGSLRDLLEAEPDHDPGAFRESVFRGLESQGLLHDYFGVRAQVVTGATAAWGIPSRLSGLLIGYELAEALRRGLVAPKGSVAVVGDGALADRYREAIEIAGLTATVAPAVPCLARGWLLLAGASQPKAS